MRGSKPKKLENQMDQPPRGDSKGEKLARVAEVILRVVAHHGLDGVRFSHLSRTSGVSRSWIYKYGGSREDLIAFAVQHFGKILLMSVSQTRKSIRTKEAWLDFQAEEFARFLGFLRREPLVLSVYFRFRGSENVLGKAIADFEKMHDQQQSEEISRLFAIPTPSASLMSELIGNLRWGLAHSWVQGPLAHMTSLIEMKNQFRALVSRIDI